MFLSSWVKLSVPSSSDMVAFFVIWQPVKVKNHLSTNSTFSSLLIAFWYGQKPEPMGGGRPGTSIGNFVFFFSSAFLTSSSSLDLSSLLCSLSLSPHLQQPHPKPIVWLVFPLPRCLGAAWLLCHCLFQFLLFGSGVSGLNKWLCIPQLGSWGCF